MDKFAQLVDHLMILYCEYFQKLNIQYSDKF